MSLRLHVLAALAAGEVLELPEEAARHVQVRRLQPGDGLRLFDGRDGEWDATIERMGRREVQVRVGAHVPTDRELPLALEIALGMPANERMDALVEKATELGVAVIQPLQARRSVLRLDPERAARRVAHWQAVAVGASEQSGRTRVPRVAAVRSLEEWLAEGGREDAACHLLSPEGAPGLPAVLAGPHGRAARFIGLSGPEGGFAPEEIAAAGRAGFEPVGLGPRVLRADTAPLAWIAQVAALLAPGR